MNTTFRTKPEIGDEALSMPEISEDQYKTIFEITSEGVIIIDTESRILSINPAGCAIFGYNPEDLIGKSFSTLLPAEHKQYHERVVSGSSIDTPKIVNRNRALKGLRRSGEVFPVEVNVAPLGDGAERRYVGIFRDISERVNGERMLHRRQKMESLGQLTGGLAHEFNNLLGIILGNVDLLSDEFSSKSALESLDTIERTASRAAELTRRLLDFSRPVPISEDIIQIETVIKRVHELLPKSSKPLIENFIELPENLWPCAVNREEFETALIALVMNSYEAMPAGGRVRIEAENISVSQPIAAEQAVVPVGDYVRVRVHDNGMGIPDNIRERIFEPFFTTKTNTKASGLGLSNVFGFVNRSHGYLTVDTAVTRGTKIELYLPSAASRSKDAGSSLGSEKKPVSVNGNRVLIVDDEIELGQYAEQILQEAGYETTVKSDANLAMTELDPRNASYDILVTDIMMPGEISGLDLATFAKASHPDIKIIAVSGAVHGTPVTNWKPGIFDHVIWKPYRKDDFLKVLHRKD